MCTGKDITRQNIFLGVATPYNTRETAGWLIRNVVGLSRKNARFVEYIPNDYIFNKGLECRYKIVAIGDILPMNGRRLSIGKNLAEFVNDGDCLVGNFAGTITGAKRKRWPLALDQRHDPQIIDALSEFFPTKKTYLSVSNNHAGDFGKEEFLRSVKMLEARGFGVFGWNERPYALVNEDLRIITGTMWSNRACDYVFTLDKAERYIKSGAFNLLYPHFGFELERYPRPDTIKLARSLIRKFDAIVASHPHCPQPVTREAVAGSDRLLAYSLGDFCCGLKMKKYQYGIIIKAEVGQDRSGNWFLGKSQWRLVRCQPGADGHFSVDLEPACPTARLCRTGRQSGGPA